MKTPTPRWFSRNYLLSQFRIASAVTLMSSAAAMAFVAAKPSGPFLLGKSDNTDQAINKFRQSRDQFGGNRRAMPGPETDRGPLAAAEERYAHRAQCDRNTDLRRRDRHALCGNRRTERIGRFGSRFWYLQIERQR